MKKIVYLFIDIVSVLLILCAVGVLLTVLMTGSGKAPSVMGYSVFRVMTGSMEPSIPTNSLIVVKKVEPSTLQVGDIISFYSRDPSLDGAVNTHRIVAVERDGGQYLFTTRGDANNVDDRYTTLDSDLLGQVVFVSTRLGVAVQLLSNPLVFIPIILIPLGLMLLVNLHQTVSLTKTLAKEEEDKARQEALEAIRQLREQKHAENGGDTE